MKKERKHFITSKSDQMKKEIKIACKGSFMSGTDKYIS